MSNFDYDYQRNPNNPFRHAGFRFGITGGVIMVIVHLMLLLIFRGTNQGDLIGWFIGWFVYVMIGRAAAQAHYNSRIDDPEPTRGVEGAGLGAAMITSLIVWFYIIARAVFREATGYYFIIADPVSLFCAIFIDMVIAMGLGRWAGNMVKNKYKIGDY